MIEAMETAVCKKPGLARGSILVMGLLLLCFVGTGLTWWNYTRQVFSSADAIILRPQQGSDIRISVELPLREAKQVLPGHRARITIGKDPHAFKGEVISIAPGVKAAAVIIHLLGGEGEAPGSSDAAASGPGAKQGRCFPPGGARCGVTIDTTVPPFSMDLPK